MPSTEYDFGWPHNEAAWESKVKEAIKSKKLKWVHVVDSQYTLSGE